MTKRSASKPADPRPVKRCAIYTRQSVAKGADQEFGSLDAQRDTCEQYVRTQTHQGWELVAGRYDDGGFSGKDMDRPAFQRLMADVDAGKVDIVVVYKIDRLSRSLLDFAQLMQRFERAGASFVAVTQNFSTADAIGRLTLNLLMSFAEFEREMISERTRDKIAASRRRGQWTGGPAPFGYRLVAKKLVVDHDEAALVREMFAAYTEHRSTRGVAELLNARRVAGREWSTVSVLNALRNVAYVGLVAHGEERYQGQHEPIVEKALFDRVQERLTQQSHGAARSPRTSGYLLTGILRCARCAGAMTSASTYKRGREYRYYRCKTRDTKGKAACSAGPLPAAEIEGFVIDRLREATANGRLAQDVAEQFGARLEVRREALLAERAELPKRIGRLSAASSAVIEKLATADDGAALETRLVKIRTELEQAHSRVATVEKALSLLKVKRSEAAWVAKVLREFDPIWEALTPENRTRLVHALVEDVEVDEPSGTVTARLRTFALGENEGAAA